MPTQTYMPSQIAPTDEYILAAFLSGQLPDPLRQEIISYLTNSRQARDILSMARDAMDSVDSGDGMGSPDPRPVVTSDGKMAPSPETVVMVRKRLDERTMWKVTAVFAGAVLVLALIVMALVLDSNSRVSGAAEWAARVEGDNLELTWPSVPGATSYQILQFDAATHQARVVAAVERPRAELGSILSASTGLISIIPVTEGIAPTFQKSYQVVRDAHGYYVLPYYPETYAARSRQAADMEATIARAKREGAWIVTTSQALTWWRARGQVRPVIASMGRDEMQIDLINDSESPFSGLVMEIRGRDGQYQHMRISGGEGETLYVEDLDVTLVFLPTLDIGGNRITLTWRR